MSGFPGVLVNLETLDQFIQSWKTHGKYEQMQNALENLVLSWNII